LLEKFERVFHRTRLTAASGLQKDHIGMAWVIAVKLLR